jgi:tetratricopeptide (TPR) repeat protein
MKRMILYLFFILLTPEMLGAQSTTWFQRGLDATEPKEQIEYFTKSIELQENLSDSYFCRANARLSKGDVQGAIDDYSKCIDIDPEDAGAYYSRAVAKQQISIDYQGAVADLVKAFEIDPASPSCINLLNEVYMKNEDYHGAVKFYNKLLELYPDNAAVYGNLGYCNLALKNYSSALKNFNTSLSLEPEQIAVILGIALVKYYNHNSAEAKKYLYQAIERYPILKQGAEGFEIFKNEGYIFNQKDDEALKKMFREWQ